MQSISFRLFLSITLCLLPLSALAQNATAISPDSCVDPSGFTTCLNTANTQEATCINEAGGNDELIIGCSWQKDVNDLLCYMSDCWNKVYSCEYQYLATSYLVMRTEETVPFYPAPVNAAGGCSCNMGNVLQNATASIELIQSKCANYQFTGGSTLSNCQCCAWSAALSSFYGICPNTDPTEIGINKLAKEVSDYTSITGTCSNLNSDTCWGKFSIGSADDGTYVDPDSLPAGGSDPLTTTKGVGYPLTSPPGGQIMTVTLLSATHTVTAAAYNAKNVASGASATSTGSSHGTGSNGSGSASGSGSGATGTAHNLGQSTFSLPPLHIYVGFCILVSLVWL